MGTQFPFFNTSQYCDFQTLIKQILKTHNRVLMYNNHFSENECDI